ncbi:TPA: glycosyltransferase, partial [Escherichia coli]|nr:glycosyltransferase [Escherichia coli]
MNKVSILMPVYNVEKYIRAAIASILNQTYPNIELVIVDDAS